MPPAMLAATTPAVWLSKIRPTKGRRGKRQQRHHEPDQQRGTEDGLGGVLQTVVAMDEARPQAALDHVGDEVREHAAGGEVAPRRWE